MTVMHSDFSSVKNPWSILGLALDADDNQIRSAYLQKVKEYPPDRAAEQFERIRDAYEQLRDPHRRSKCLIFGVDFRVPLVSLLDGSDKDRRFVGPRPWLEALKKG